MDDIKKKLLMDEVSFVAASKMYEHIIQNNHYTQKPDSIYMKNLVEHQSELARLAEHSVVKANSNQCLNCENVLACQVKCSDFNKTDK